MVYLESISGSILQIYMNHIVLQGEGKIHARVLSGLGFDATARICLA